MCLSGHALHIWSVWKDQKQCLQLHRCRCICIEGPQVAALEERNFINSSYKYVADQAAAESSSSAPLCTASSCTQQRRPAPVAASGTRSPTACLDWQNTAKLAARLPAAHLVLGRRLRDTTRRVSQGFICVPYFGLLHETNDILDFRRHRLGRLKLVFSGVDVPKQSETVAAVRSSDLPLCPGRRPIQTRGVTFLPEVSTSRMSCVSRYQSGGSLKTSTAAIGLASLPMSPATGSSESAHQERDQNSRPVECSWGFATQW